MDVNKLAVPLMAFVKKYRYVILILVLGIVLMCLPGRNDSKISVNEATIKTEETIDLTKKVEELLSGIEGAGKVKVLMTESAGEKYIYQSDSDTNVNSDSSSVRSETVIISDSNRNEQALLVQIIPPCYCGAVILCQGGDKPAVRLAVVEAVSKLTGIGADRICVLKMK